MTLNEITGAMQAYKNLQKKGDSDQMIQLFSEGNAFQYERDPNNKVAPGGNQPYVHAYPGIINGELKMFVISAYLDVSNNPDIANQVKVYSLVELQPSATSIGGGLPITEALTRIDAWINNYQTWIKTNISTMFGGFLIPQDDSSFGNYHNAFFALNGQIADIVVEDIENQQIEYFDTVTPVPPFGSGAAAESCFYLLSLIS